MNLEERIIEVLKNKSGLKAQEIADALAVEFGVPILCQAAICWNRRSASHVEFEKLASVASD
jgi:hypothetical protein